ncbi:MAG: filamentous hemagglutinin N-terminal domain-containing protein, partial [Rhodoferax sp.]
IMNSSYRSLWNDSTGTFVAVPENASSSGKKTSSGVQATGLGARFVLQALAVSVMLAFGANALAQPTGGVVASGDATISTGATSTTITQSTSNAIINWQSFNIAAGQSVQFVQPTSSSITLNRVVGADPSSILGSLSANGKVFLINPNGILFGQGASVNVGGLVASTLNMTDADFNAGNYKFSGNGTGSVLNQGNINADGGYVALLGANVSNQGTISAQLGSVVLAAGSVMTMDVAGDGLLNIAVTEGAVNALVENGGLIRADGGQVLLTTQAAGSLLANSVNNTGVIQAQTLVTGKTGSIMLMGGMETGTVNVGGTLDASAPNGGNGGFIETSAAYVKVANDVKVTTAAPQGQTGTWLIDPLDYTVGSGAGDNITGATLSANLVDNNITITTIAGPGSGFGDININEAVSWNGATGATATPTTLTLNALRDTNINAAISATTGNLVVCCGRDINVNAAITTVNGSVLLAAGQDVNILRTTLNDGTAITTTDGNIEICAGRNITLSNTFNPGLAPLMTLTRGSTTAGEDLASLGVPLGLTLMAGTGGTGPGVDSGTVIFTNGGLAGTYITYTAGGPGTPAAIYYNPTSYATPTDYSLNFTGNGGPLTQYMLVYPGGADKTYDGNTVATFTGLKGAPAGVTLGGAGTANFDTAAVGTNKTVTFNGFTLEGASAGNYAFANSCCGPAVSRTTANINAVVLPPDVATPPVPPPAGTPDVVDTDLFPDMPYEGPVVNRRTPLTWAPVVVLADTPAQLQSLTPPVVFVPAVPVELAPVAPEEEVIETPVQPPVYVAPARPRKQDRN